MRWNITANCNRCRTVTSLVPVPQLCVVPLRGWFHIFSHESQKNTCGLPISRNLPGFAPSIQVFFELDKATQPHPSSGPSASVHKAVRMRSSDSSEDGRGRVRAQTYPPRPSPRLSETNLQPDREGWLNNAMNGHRNSWPYPFKKKLGAGFGSGLFLHNKRSCGGGSIEGLGSSGSWSTKKFTRTSPTPTSCESGGSASSRSGTTPRGTPRALRRRYHRKGGWAEGTALPTTRQQRLVTSMFALVVILGSIQILALIVHPPGGGGFGVSSLSGIGRGGPGIAASVGGSGARRRVSGAFQDNFLRSPSAVVSNAAAASAGGLRAGTFNNNEITQRQDQTLSLANPRAFEMVAADMGHLKNTVSRNAIKWRALLQNRTKDVMSTSAEKLAPGDVSHRLYWFFASAARSTLHAFHIKHVRQHEQPKVESLVFRSGACIDEIMFLSNRNRPSSRGASPKKHAMLLKKRQEALPHFLAGYLLLISSIGDCHEQGANRPVVPSRQTSCFLTRLCPLVPR